MKEAEEAKQAEEGKEAKEDRRADMAGQEGPRRNYEFMRCTFEKGQVGVISNEH